MSDPQRQQRISMGAQTRVDQPQPTAPPASAFRRVPAIVTSVDVANFSMKWKGIGYQDSPPQKDRFKTDSEEKTGYPLEGLDISAYSSLIVSGDFTSGSSLVFAYKRGGVWIIEPAAMAGGLKIAAILSAPSTGLSSIVVQAARLSSAPGGVPQYAASGESFSAMCWPNSTSTDFNSHIGTVGSANAAYVLLVFWDGTWWAHPTYVFYALTPNSSVPRGDCAVN